MLQKALETEGSSSPRTEALYLLTLIEGATIFMGKGRRWESDAQAFGYTVLGYVDNRYPNKP
jgi:hypothetical protein